MLLILNIIKKYKRIKINKLNYKMILKKKILSLIFLLNSNKIKILNNKENFYLNKPCFLAYSPQLTTHLNCGFPFSNLSKALGKSSKENSSTIG